MATLRNLFLSELADIYDAENRIANALPKMAEAATNPALKAALTSHLEETKGHIEKVARIFKALGEECKREACKATAGLLEDCDKLVSENKGGATINAAIISACQKVEHYEIVTYGTLVEWASLLKNDEAGRLLEEILIQEENADEKLTELSVEGNQEALGEQTDLDVAEEAVTNGSPGRN